MCIWSRFVYFTRPLRACRPGVKGDDRLAVLLVYVLY